MIEILGTSTLLPEKNGHVPLDNSQLAMTAPAGLARSMNRTGLLLAECALKLPLEALKLIRENAVRTGIYCAAEPSTLGHEEIQKWLAHPEPSSYARLISPKWGLQCSIGLAASAAAILLDIEGGVHTFNHPLWSCRHALDQAVIDLQEEVIDYALVCGVASFEDPLMIARWRAEHPEVQFAEGAGILFLKRGVQSPPEFTAGNPDGLFFGCADSLIKFLDGSGRE